MRDLAPELALWGLVIGLGLVVVFHLYWAAGGRLGADAVIPRKPVEQGGEPLFHPSPIGTLMVAAFLLGVIGLGIVVQRGADITVPWRWSCVLLAG